jgi:hypothetical protein
MKTTPSQARQLLKAVLDRDGKWYSRRGVFPVAAIRVATVSAGPHADEKEAAQESGASQSLSTSVVRSWEAQGLKAMRAMDCGDMCDNESVSTKPSKTVDAASRTRKVAWRKRTPFPRAIMPVSNAASRI